MNDQLTAWSLFSGVGGFDLGLERAGVRVRRQCESDAWRRRVLASHWPGVPCSDDVAALSVADGDELPDILCGGFPCQDLSVAGRRAGLAGDRSVLFFEFARLAEECRLAERGGWIFLENVPGLFSSNGGRDFGVVLGTLADLGFAVAYRVLDSRYHGVPQRRRRVFLVGHPRADYARAVLLDPQGRLGDPEAGVEERPEDSLASLSGLGNGGQDDNDAQAGRLVAFQCHGSNVGPMGTLRTGNGGLTGGVPFVAVPDVAAPLTSGTPPNSNQAGRRKEDDVNLVAFALRGREDGSMPEVHDDGQTVGSLRAASGGSSRHYIAFHLTQDPISEEGFTPALSGRGNTGATLGVAFVSENQRAEVLETEYAHQLTTGGGKPGQGYPCARIVDVVRRLTPRECERLQGFPDDWTAVDGLPTYQQARDGSWRCKTGTPDAKRCAAMGDAVTVNVIEQIARRLVAVSEGSLCP